jgi:hypothetical protein
VVDVEHALRDRREGGDDCKDVDADRKEEGVRWEKEGGGRKREEGGRKWSYTRLGEMRGGIAVADLASRVG